MRVKGLISFFAIGLLTLLFAHPALCQSNVNEERGLKPYDSLTGSAIDSVSVTNGGLTLHIPIASFPQRGDLDLSFFLRYNTHQWQVQRNSCETDPITNKLICTYVWDPGDGLQPGTGLSGVEVMSSMDWLGPFAIPKMTTSNKIAGYNYNVSSSDGNVHSFGYDSISNTTVYPRYATDGTGLMLRDATTLVLPNGTVIAYPPPDPMFGAAVQPTSMTDRNGNQITLGSSGWKDTLGRSIPGSCGNARPCVIGAGVPTNDLTNCPSNTVSAIEWDVPGVGGATRTYKFCYANVTLQTSFHDSYPATEYGPTTVSLLGAVVLPDLTAWTFTYDSYGDVTRVGWPTGGSISYTYQIIIGSAPTGGCSGFTDARRVVVSRTEDANDGTGGHTTYYGFPVNSTGNVVVTDPAQNDVVYTVGAQAGGGCGLWVSQTQYFQGSSSNGGTLLKTLATQYSPVVTNATTIGQNGGVVPTQTSVTLPNGNTSRTVFTYDTTSFTEPNGVALVNAVGALQQDEYDFSGTLYRSTINHYVWQDNANYKNANLLTLRASSTTQDPSQTPALQTAQTSYYYDQFNLPASGVTIGLVAAGPYRGNLTGVARWVNTSNTSISTTNTYYDSGMRASTRDTLGNTTNFSYSANYAGAYLTQTNAPDTQMPDPNAPIVHHVTSATYDYNTGLLGSFTDENGNPFSYQYDNARLRLTQANHPDKGWTKFFYPNSTTVERQRSIDGIRFDDYFVYFDGLGRTVQTQQITPTCTVQVDTTYDSVGRVSKVSNPYCQGSNHATDPTYGVTQTQYDALGRTLQVTKPDGSIASAQYDNNCTVAVDESGRPRRACSDAFGRLIEVDEPAANSPGAAATASITISGSVGSYQTGAPAAAAAGSGLSGFSDSSGTQHWAYLGANEHLYHVYWTSAKGYAFDDVTAATGAPVAAGTAVTGFVSSVPQWAYFGSNQHVYNFWQSGSNYGFQDATAGAGAPAAAAGSPLVGFVDSGGAQHWAYFGTNQHVYNVYWNGSYGSGDATAASGAPAAAPGSALTAFADPNGGQHWAYLGTNQHVYNLYWTSSSGYGYQDATAGANAPASASGSKLAGFADSGGGQHWAYLDANGHGYNLYWNSGSYGYSDLTSVVSAPAASGNAIAGFTDSGGAQHWTYFGSNLHAYNFWWNGSYGYQDATAGAGAPAAASGSALAGFKDPNSGQHWTYFGSNQDVYNVWWSGSYGYQDINTAADLVYDSGIVSLTVGGFKATACYGSSGNAACTGQPVNTTAAQVATALANVINNSSTSPATAVVSGATLNLTWKTTGAVNVTVNALQSTPDNPGLFSGSFSSGSSTFSGGLLATLGTGQYVTLYQYDTRDNLRCVEQHGNVNGTGCAADASNDATSPWRVRRFTYDSLGNLLTSKNPENGTLTYHYDSAGRLSTRTDAGGTIVSYQYRDTTNGGVRLTDITYNDNTPASHFRYDYSWYNNVALTNVIGRQNVTLSDNGAKYLAGYDSMGRPQNTQQCTPGVATCQNFSANYDSLGDVTSLAYPNGFKVTYGYDNAARQISAQDNAGFTYATAQPTDFLPAGSLKQFETANFNYQVSYNNRLQPVEISAGTFFDKQYNYNPGANNGDVISVTNIKNNGRSQSFTYDSLNRLLTAGDKMNWSDSYVYDPWGNLTQKNPGGQGESLQATADVHNHLIAQDSRGRQIYTYDTVGNLLTDGFNAYTYDAENRVKTVNKAPTYTYDGAGRRIAKSTGEPSWYGPDGAILAETDANGNWTNYVYAFGRRLARNVPQISPNPPDIKFYITDHLGSTSMFVDKNGTVQDDNDFYPWGGVVPNVGFTNSTNHFKFTGKERDSESNLDYFGGRYYSSTLGRWTSADWAAVPAPVPYANFGDPQTLNLYAYVRNVPTVGIDPTGHRWESEIAVQSGWGLDTALFSNGPVIEDPVDDGLSSGFLENSLDGDGFESGRLETAGTGQDPHNHAGGQEWEDTGTASSSGDESLIEGGGAAPKYMGGNKKGKTTPIDNSASQGQQDPGMGFPVNNPYYYYAQDKINQTAQKKGVRVYSCIVTEGEVDWNKFAKAGTVGGIIGAIFKGGWRGFRDGAVAGLLSMGLNELWDHVHDCVVNPGPGPFGP